MEACVEEVRQELRADGEELQTENAANQLIVDLPEEIPIYEIERMPGAEN